MRLLALWSACCCLAAAEIAVWDPHGDTATDRLSLHGQDWDAVASWLGGAGMTVVRVDGTAMCRPGGLDASRTPVLVMSAHHVPLAADPAAREAGQLAYRAYLDAGGIIIGLGTAQGSAAFGAAIEPAPAGGWRLSPPEPRFAWEIAGLRDAIGLRYVYDLERHDRGIRHEPTVLLRRYWPDAPVVTAQLRQVQHIPAAEGVAVHALYASSDLDGAQQMPAVGVVRNGRRTAILVAHPGWWSAPAPAWFAGARPLTVALVRIALDLHDGSLPLPADPFRPAQPGQAAPGPLRDRLPLGEAEPAGAVAVVRWGRFDGSCRDLGGPGQALPARLDPGGSVLLPVPARSQAAWLRIRGAVRGDDAGIAAYADGAPLLCERLIATGASGQAADPRTDPPIELTRCAFLPPGPAMELRLSNPGTAPLWFDAVQIETRGPGCAGPLGIGLAAFASLPDALPAELRQAALLSIPVHLDELGDPGDARRWERLDAVFARAQALGLPIQARLVGTPERLADPASLAEARVRGRPAAARPRPAAQRADLIAWAQRYGSRVAEAVLGDEVDVAASWCGSLDDYAGFAADALPLLRAALPSAVVGVAAPANPSGELLDALERAGVDGVASLPVHAYGSVAAWDRAAGRVAGDALSRGQPQPVAVCAHGFPAAGEGWTGERQALALDAALARLLAAGTSQVVVADPGTMAAPAAAVFADYAALNGRLAVRTDIRLLAADARPLRGVYAVASQDAYGVVTVLISACQADGPQRLTLAVPLPDERPRLAQLRIAGRSMPAPSRQRGGAAAAWCELDIELDGRCVLSLVPR